MRPQTHINLIGAVAPRRDSNSSNEGDDISPHITLYAKGSAGYEKQAPSSASASSASLKVLASISESAYSAGSLASAAAAAADVVEGEDRVAQKSAVVTETQPKSEGGQFSYGAYVEARRGATTRAERQAAVARWGKGSEGAGAGAAQAQLQQRRQRQWSLGERRGLDLGPVFSAGECESG